ncbi:MAG: histidinol-phosphate aminotransferase family protein [Rhodospirillales bacterium]|nr:histidinol-phosphate aminotransferase family protein [Rhodospirillales bacterium]
MQNSIPPKPIFVLENPDLIRPNWTAGEHRDPSKMWLDKNENTDQILSDCTAKVLREIDQSNIYAYPESGPLYRKLADHLGVSPKNIYIAAGSDGIIRSLYEIYIDRGDVVVYPSPTFAMYSVYSRIYGGKSIELEYQASSSGPILTVDQIAEALRSHQPKLFCLPNPDSPTGTVFDPEELKKIISIGAELQIPVLIDEAYFPFYNETAANWIDTFANLVVARSTGKAWGMAGFRIGFAIANVNTIRHLHKVRPMYEANTIAVAVFEKMLDHKDEMLAAVERLNAGKEYFLDEMRKLGFRTLTGHGNFLHVAFGEHAIEIHEALSDLVYYRQNFSQPCLEGFSRFSATSEDNFRILVDKIRTIAPTSKQVLNKG